MSFNWNFNAPAASSSSSNTDGKDKDASKSVSFSPFTTNIPKETPTAFSFAPLKPSATHETPLPFSFGGSSVKPSSSDATAATPSEASTAATPVAPTTGVGVGTASTTATPATPVAASTLFSPGPMTMSALKPATTTENKSVASGQGTTNVTLPSATSTSTPATSTMSSVIQNRTLEEIINKWSKELDAHAKSFHKQAIEINTWDQALIDRGTKIAALHDQVMQAEGMQKELDQNLEYLESQQAELSGMLGLIEADVQKIFNNPPELQPSDTEREKMYSLAEAVGSELNDVDENLNELVENLNTFFEAANDEDNPAVEIVKILNSHLNVLQWADESTQALRQKLQDIEKQKESEIVSQSRLYGTNSR